MSIAFTAELVVAHKGITTVAFAKEEEKETEDKKSKEDKLKSLPTFYILNHSLTAQSISAFYQRVQLSAGYHTKPFNPPDVI